jgi:hypothetical protein
VRDWWTDDDLAEPGRIERLQQDQQADYALWERSGLRARVAYNAGIVVLAIGVAIMLAPPDSGDHLQAAFRWAAASVAAAGALGELAWGIASIIGGR